jgi:hypothetical protein
MPFCFLMAPEGLRFNPLGPKLIDVTRAIGRVAHGAAESWDALWTDDKTLNTLLTIWTYVLTLDGDPHEQDLAKEMPPQFNPATHEHVLFTDASKEGLGWA